MKDLASFLLLFLLLTSCVRHAESEDFHFEDGFEGPVILLFDQPTGVDTDYKEDRRQYHIPKSGVYKTKLSRVKGGLNQKFYFENKEEILNRNVLSSLNPRKYYIDYVQDGFFGIIEGDGLQDVSTDTLPKIRFISFNVLKGSSDRDSMRNEMEILLDSVREAQK